MQSPTVEYNLTIHRVTGKPLRFKLPRTSEQIREAGSAIEKSLAANYIGVIQDNKLVIIPSHQIASVEIDPAPKVFIQHVIKDATARSAMEGGGV
jgi:hypothetical protein